MRHRFPTAGALLLVACQTTSDAPADTAPPPVRANPVVAQWDGGSLLLDDVEARIDDELRKMDIEYKMSRFERVRDVLDGAVEDAIIAREVARRGLTHRDELFRLEVDAKLTEPTEEELRVAFQAFLENMPHATFEGARKHLRDQVLRTRKQERREAFLESLREASGVTVSLPFPDVPRLDVPVDDHDPVLGAADAPVTIVQFSGFQCYYCRRVDPSLRRLVADMPGDVRVVHKDFPLAGHARARSAAIAAHCAGDDFWAMSRMLLENQGQLEPDHLRDYASKVGVDIDAWSTCLEDDAWHRHIDDDMRLGRALGVTSTPTFFVNGLMITGAHSYERFRELVEVELAAANR